MNERQTKLGKKQIVMTKINLVDANKIMIPVMSSMTKYCIGDFNLFSHYSQANMDTVQTMYCKYITFKKTGQNLTLQDLNDNIEYLVGLFCEFLEFNFGFFSQAPKLGLLIGGIISGREEIEKSTIDE